MAGRSRGLVFGSGSGLLADRGERTERRQDRFFVDIAQHFVGDLGPHGIEIIGEQLRSMMPWISANKIVDKAKN